MPDGGSGGAGVIGIAGTAASGGTRQTAVAAQQGDLTFTSVVDVTSTTSLTNTLTPKNVVKAWAYITTTGGGAIAVSDAFNITSVGLSSGEILVTFAGDFALANFACTVTGESDVSFVSVHDRTTGSIKIRRTDYLAGPVSYAIAPGDSVSIICMGAQ